MGFLHTPLSVCVSFSYIHISNFGECNVSPFHICWGCLQSHYIYLLRVAPHFYHFHFLYYQYKIFCVGIQISLPLHLITTPTYIYQDPLTHNSPEVYHTIHGLSWSKYSGFPSDYSVRLQGGTPSCHPVGKASFFFFFLFWP